MRDITLECPSFRFFSDLFLRGIPRQIVSTKKKKKEASFLKGNRSKGFFMVYKDWPLRGKGRRELKLTLLNGVSAKMTEVILICIIQGKLLKFQLNMHGYILKFMQTKFHF